MGLLRNPRGRVLCVLAFWALCAVAAGAGYESTDSSWVGGPWGFEALLEGIASALLLAGPGFVLLAVLILIVLLPVAAAGALLDIGGRALALRARTAC